MEKLHQNLKKNAGAHGGGRFTQRTGKNKYGPPSPFGAKALQGKKKASKMGAIQAGKNPRRVKKYKGAEPGRRRRSDGNLQHDGRTWTKRERTPNQPFKPKK